MTSVAVTLAEWAAGLEPGREDLELAHRSLLDTVAVTLAAREHRVTRLAAPLTTGGRGGGAGAVGGGGVASRAGGGVRAGGGRPRAGGISTAGCPAASPAGAPAAAAGAA